MKFLVPNYSCLQNTWLGGYRPQIPVLSVLNWICWTAPPPEQNSWVRHCRVTTQFQLTNKSISILYLFHSLSFCPLRAETKAVTNGCVNYLRFSRYCILDLSEENHGIPYQDKSVSKSKLPNTSREHYHLELTRSMENLLVRWATIRFYRIAVLLRTSR